jgi:hypothetical protein
MSGQKGVNFNDDGYEMRGNNALICFTTHHAGPTLAFSSFSLFPSSFAFFSSLCIYARLLGISDSPATICVPMLGRREQAQLLLLMIRAWFFFVFVMELPLQLRDGASITFKMELQFRYRHHRLFEMNSPFPSMYPHKWQIFAII